MKTIKPKLAPTARFNKPLFVNVKDLGYKEMCCQIKQRGFASSELWTLDYAIALFVLPRLREFAKNSRGHPFNLTPRQWEEILADMVFAFEMTVNEHSPTREYKGADWKRMDKGFRLFGKWFRHLWD